VPQLTLKASHPQNLPSEIAENFDVASIFGSVTMQACVVEETTKRKCYRCPAHTRIQACTHQNTSLHTPEYKPAHTRIARLKRSAY